MRRVRFSQMFHAERVLEVLQMPPMKLGRTLSATAATAMIRALSQLRWILRNWILYRLRNEFKKLLITIYVHLGSGRDASTAVDGTDGERAAYNQALQSTAPCAGCSDSK